MAENVKYKAYFEDTYMSWHKETDCGSGENSYNLCKKDYISMLPPELIMKIFGYLTFSEVRRCAVVCKQWHKISLADTLWRTVEIKNKFLHMDVLKRILDKNVETLILKRVTLEMPLESTFEPSKFYMLQHITFTIYNTCHYEIMEKSWNFVKKLPLITPYLKSLTFIVENSPFDTPSFTPAVLWQLSKLKHLEKLELGYLCLSHQFNNLDNLKNIQGFNQLKVLSLSNISSSWVSPGQPLTLAHLGTALKNFLGLFQNLNGLYLTNVQLSEAALEQILENQRLNNMEHFENDLYQNPVNHERFGVLQHFSFFLSSYDSTEVNFLKEFLSLSPYLKTFVISNHRDEFRAVYFESDFFKQLFKLKHLEVLKLPSMKFTCLNDVLRVVGQSKRFDKLKVLQLSACEAREFTFETREFTFETREFTVETFIENFLNLCANITDLILFGTFFNNAIFRCLLSMPYLKKLEITLLQTPPPLAISSDDKRWFTLEELYIRLQGPHIRPDKLDIEPLMQASPNLIRLHLENCFIDAKVLRSINAMNKLRRLCMHNVQGISKDQFYFIVKNYPRFERCNVVLKE